MKTRLLSLTGAIAVGLFFTSCEDDELKVAAPVVTLTEVGTSNSGIGYVGTDLHLEADIVAEGTIDLVTVEIHSEDGSGDEIEAEYDDYAGLLNATFHKHIDIPAGTTPGEYHLHITVTDMEGNSTTVEAELLLEESTDTEGPEISISVAPAANASYSSGQSISISGQVTDNVAIGGMVVALVRQGGSQEADDVIIMLLEYYEDTEEMDFAATIAAGAEYDNQSTPEQIEGDNAWQSGEYYILVRAWDSIGNTTESAQYPITVSL